MQVRVQAISEIVSELLKSVSEGLDVNLNHIKNEVRRSTSCLMC